MVYVADVRFPFKSRANQVLKDVICGKHVLEYSESHLFGLDWLLCGIVGTNRRLLIGLH
jgi:hypothetical protein